MSYDIVIVGGGPAGAILASNLDKRFKVAVIDKKSEAQTSFKKPCGGLLAPDAQKSISKLGMQIPLAVMVDPQIFAVETIDINSKQKRFYQRFYLNLDRHKFDLWLKSFIPNRVKNIVGNVTKVLKNEDGFDVYYHSNGEQKKISSRYVVGADGAKSIVRETFFKNRPIRQYLAIQKNYPSGDKRPFYICFFDNDITDCYGWINIKNDIIQLGAALPVATAKEGFNQFEAYFKKNGYPFEKSLYTEACLVNRPRAVREIVTGEKGVMLIGESAGFISSSSLEGISYSIDSALELSQAFNTNFNKANKAYNKRARKLKMKMFLKMRKSFFIYNKFMRRLIMKSGITSIDVKSE